MISRRPRAQAHRPFQVPAGKLKLAGLDASHGRTNQNHLQLDRRDLAGSCMGRRDCEVWRCLVGQGWAFVGLSEATYITDLPNENAGVLRTNVAGWVRKMAAVAWICCSLLQRPASFPTNTACGPELWESLSKRYVWGDRNRPSTVGGNRMLRPERNIF
jgi:hypothetical protein